MSLMTKNVVLKLCVTWQLVAKMKVYERSALIRIEMRCGLSVVMHSDCNQCN